MGQPPEAPDFPAMPTPVELTEDTIETEVRTPVPENELVEDMDCTMLFPAAELLLEFASLIWFTLDGHVGLIAIKLGPILRVCKKR